MELYGKFGNGMKLYEFVNGKSFLKIEWKKYWILDCVN